MLDLFALALTHGLMALAAWRLLQRDDLDHDPAVEDQAAPPPGGLRQARPRIADRLRRKGACPRV
jgi:hypothetical protein